MGNKFMDETLGYGGYSIAYLIDHIPWAVPIQTMSGFQRPAWVLSFYIRNTSCKPNYRQLLLPAKFRQSSTVNHSQMQTSSSQSCHNPVETSSHVTKQIAIHQAIFICVDDKGEITRLAQGRRHFYYSFQFFHSCHIYVTDLALSF